MLTELSLATHHQDLLGSELAKPADGLYRHNLTGVLESAIRATNAQYDDDEFKDRLDVRLLKESPGDMGWDVFSLEVLSHWLKILCSWGAHRHMNELVLARERWRLVCGSTGKREMATRVWNGEKHIH